MSTLTTLPRAVRLPLGLLAAALLLAAPARAQLTIAGGSMTITPSTIVSVGGAVDVQSAGTLDNQGSLLLTGNLTNTGTIGTGTGLWQLNGATLQSMTSTGTGALGTLEVNNAAGATLGAALTAGKLDVSAGPLRLASFDLTLTATSGAIANANATNRFVVTNGSGRLFQPVGTALTSFPVGWNDTNLRPASITRSAGTATYAVRVAQNALVAGPTGAPYTTHAVALRWTIAAPDAVPYLLGAAWATTDELPTFDRTQSALARWNGSIYVPTAFTAATPVPGGFGTQSPGLTADGTFIVADRQAPLPVQLSRFEAKRPAGQPRVELSWATASEVNNLGFEVQRRDEGQTDFRRVGFVAGAGTSLSPHQYAFPDPNTFDGLSYYRLQQVDLDGTNTFSPVRVVSGLPGGTVFSLSAYPNPARDVATLEVSGPVPADLTLTLYAADGRLVWSGTWPTGQTKMPLSAQGLATGAYWLRYQATATQTTGSVKLVVGQ